MNMNIVFTSHAQKRLSRRDITEENVIRAIRMPDKIIKQEKDGFYKFIKIINEREVQVIAKKLTVENKWLVVSVWVRGEEDKPNIIIRTFVLIYRLIKLLFK